MSSGAYTSSGKAGRLFFKRTAFFFWEDSEWGAELFARAPKGEPVYFSMICSASSSRRRLICHVVSTREMYRGRSPTSLTRCCLPAHVLLKMYAEHFPEHVWPFPAASFYCIVVLCIFGRIYSGFKSIYAEPVFSGFLVKFCHAIFQYTRMTYPDCFFRESISCMNVRDSI